MIPSSPPNKDPFFRQLDATRLQDILDGVDDPRRSINMLESPMVIFCTTGTISISVDQHEFKIASNQLCAMYPYSYCKILDYSDDYTGFYFEIPLTIYRRVHAEIGTPLNVEIRTSPKFDLSTAFKERVEYFQLLFNSYAKSPLERGHSDCIFNLTLAFVNEFGNLYRSNLHTTPIHPSRQDSIFYKFLTLLSKYYLDHRDVEYYASEMAITPRHLTRVIKQKTGHSCSHWIKEIVVVHIKRMLLEDNNQVQDVSYAFHFPNPSFFSQYFKKETGMTPREYQKTYE